ncbi:hypothetical protein DFH05DRAFT_1526971 [Lentinula detonsa]|uniref:Uncharacterized protein n=1 Tax=Lentinula detonsa TaxID=2804962 RepID=A0A9W8TVX3_9AGAR|nr:hypothetical protein DFH05DRAFT_1526971 [Lentinula detonsa]
MSFYPSSLRAGLLFHSQLTLNAKAASRLFDSLIFCISQRKTDCILDMMVFSRSVLTTFLVVGTSSSVLALPFQSFSGTGLSQNDVASTATTQAMPTIPTGYVQGQSVGVQEDVKNHNSASNSPSPSGLARRISTDAHTSDNEKPSVEKDPVQQQRYSQVLAELSGKTHRTPPVLRREGSTMEPGPRSNNPGNPTSSGSDKQTRRDLFDTRNVEIESPPESDSEEDPFMSGSSLSPSTSNVPAHGTDGEPTHHGQVTSHSPSSPTGLPLAHDHRNTRSIYYGEDLD